MKKYYICCLIMVVLLALVTSCVNSAPDVNDGTDVPMEDSPVGDTPPVEDKPEHIHNFSDWSVVQNPTCTESGEKARYCSCGERQAEIIPKVGHTKVIDEAIEPTCTETGLTEGKHCSVCDEIIVEQGTIPKTSHTYDNKYDECCNKCGFIRDAECAHVNTTTLSAVAATCTQPGLTEGEVCAKCEEIIVAQTVVPAKGHTEVIDEAVEPANCISTGLTEGKHCSVCDEIIVAQTVVYGEHNFENRVCGLCGEKDYSKNLEFTSYGDGTCYVSGATAMYNYNDYLIIPPFSPEGDKVVYIHSLGSLEMYRTDYIYKIDIPDTVTKISYKIFYDTKYYQTESNWINGTLYIGNCLVGVDPAVGGEYVVREGTRVIADCAFAYCDIVSIKIPDSIKAIGYQAFAMCSSLENFEVDKNNTAYSSIDGNLYSKDGSLLIQCAPGKTDSKLIIPETVTSIGDYAVDRCAFLTEIVIPDSVVSIGTYAFNRCTSLTEIVIPNSVVSIGTYAFNYCNSLTKVAISNGITNIDDYTFCHCESLTSVVIPDGVKRIGNYAFSTCPLTSVVIYNSVESIASNVFKSTLTDIYYTGTEEEWLQISISSSNKSLTAATIHYNYVPEN